MWEFMLNVFVIGSECNIYFIYVISVYMYIYFVYIINDYMYMNPSYQGIVSSPGAVKETQDINEEEEEENVLGGETTPNAQN